MNNGRKFQSSDPSPFDSIDSVLAAFASGEFVLIVDDEKRENEGDLICAAQHITPEKVNFLLRFGKGLVCVAIHHTRCTQLGLSRMVADADNSTPFATPFTEAVDAREHTSTGISASDRATTIRLLASPEAGPGDLVKPGHVFPLQAHRDGVLARPGHTEAAVDLARLSGCEPAGALCEVLNPDGSMARLPDLLQFAQEHDIRISSVADLVRYRRTREPVIDFLRQVALPTPHGDFRLRVYRELGTGADHLALVMGAPKSEALVRIHSECLTGDVFGSLRCDCGLQIDDALRQVAETGEGAVLYLRQEGRGIGLDAKLAAYQLQDEGMDTVEANEKLGFAADLRDYTIAVQMLQDMGIESVRLLTNNPHKLCELESSGIPVVERLPSMMTRNQHNQRYLDTKKSKLGHLL